VQPPGGPVTARAPVAITGLGAVTALGIGVNAFDSALRAGRSGIRSGDSRAAPAPVWAPLPGPDILSAVARFGLREATVKQVRRAGHQSPPGLQCALVAAAEAFQQAGLDRRDEPALGLVVAGSNLTNQDVVEAHSRQLAGKQVRPRYAAQFLDSDHVGTISEALSLVGEGYTVGGASASGGVAIALGRRAILCGDMSAVLVVGPPTMLSAVELSALGAVGALFGGEMPDEPSCSCRPFDQKAAGFVYGQGAAAIVLERYDVSAEQRRRTLAVLRGASMGLDGNRATDPSVEGEKSAMREALAQAGMNPGDVDFVSTHGTSSALGDRIEAKAIREVFGAGGRPWLNATKALTGHCLSAAAIIEAVAVVLQLRGGYLHPNPTLRNPIDPSLALVGASARECAARVALSNSFGFGGINSSQVISLPEAG
jgi:malonyl-ACP decarboxylase